MRYIHIFNVMVKSSLDLRVMYNVEGGSQIAATMLELYHDKVII